MRAVLLRFFILAIAQMLRPGGASDDRERVTVTIDLGDDWTPRVLAPGSTAPAYRTTYLALAQERFDDAGSDGELAKLDRYLELFGIAPTLSVIRARLGDDTRHACHAAVDDRALARLATPIAVESREAGRERIAQARVLRTMLDTDRRLRKVADLEALAPTSRYYARAVARLAALEARIAAVRAVQAHLACDHLLGDRLIDGAYTWQTGYAVRSFQRGAMIVPTGTLDRATIEAFILDSRERDFRAALRVLRERVADAAGLLEDGTAGARVGTVLGRTLEPEQTWRVRGHDPLPGAAPDLISEATEAAALALGWNDAESTRIALDALAASNTRVASVALPRPPAYHTATMQLAIEIDRGDVWLDSTPRARKVERRPAVIIYAQDGGRQVPLARWPTTIGGWQREVVDGDIEKRWKESPAGPRIWRDLVVGPSWLPPDSTPDRELVRSENGKYVLARELMGPSYRAAFGMVAFIHFLVDSDGNYQDEGIRTHGTGSLRSIATGVSHGCHRLLGFQAVRLADFVLAHHTAIRRGETKTDFQRVVQYHGQFPIVIDSQGYRFELDPPIPVEVLPGRVHVP